MSHTIRIYGDPVLRKKAHPIVEITTGIKRLAQEMVDMMIASEAVGLAATQVGELHRIFVMRNEVLNAAGEYEFTQPEIVINPVLTKPSKEKETESEACLSLPNISLDIERPKNIHLRYQNLNGDWVEEELHGLKARIAMHENDHLNGVLILDRADARDKKRALKELKSS